MLDWREFARDPAIISKIEDLLLQRGVTAEQIKQLCDLAGRWLNTLTTLQGLQAERRQLAESTALHKRRGQPTDDLEEEGAAVRARIDDLEEKERELGHELNELGSNFPNLPAGDVPPGWDESGNQQVREWTPTGRSPIAEDSDANAKVVAHDELGKSIGMMDFTRAGQMSGPRFAVLSGALARLERALGQFMLDVHCREHGYTEYSLPLLVKETALFGTGQLPRFRDDQFRTQTGHWLIPTAEVPLVNLVAHSILAEDELPLRMAALTPCFRAEAGAAGRDTRGMIRQHQFWKVELVSITTPRQSRDEHERLTGCADTVLKRLELPFRVVLLCRGDMGFAATKTYDLEVWMPGQHAYREISSCSNCGDFQARRMRTRYRPAAGKKPRLVHTLNGSGVALGRCLIAVMENYQQPDGSILIPAALREYMDGQEFIK